MERIKIEGEFITLGQLLKKLAIVGSGGETKILLQEEMVKVNNELEVRRGRKLYPQDIVDIEEHGVFVLVQA